PAAPMSRAYSEYFRCCPKTPRSITSENPMMAFKGVRNSWLICPMKSPRARESRAEDDEEIERKGAVPGVERFAHSRGRADRERPVRHAAQRHEPSPVRHVHHPRGCRLAAQRERA